ncbi:MAG: response regulator transcription factor [Bacteroidales bacterium]|nr:response regulator transcription factor [Bacteroidales bacterium]
MENKKSIALIGPSPLVAKGIESILSEMGEFRVEFVLADLSPSSEARIKNTPADIIIVDPMIFGIEERGNARNRFSALSGVPCLALQTNLVDEESLKQYDGVISIYDSPVSIVKKLRKASESDQDLSHSDTEGLSSREKEILVCVAKGMLNKEIADYYNISIYTVITHRKNITRKTGIKTVAGLTVYALLNTLIDINSIE